MRILINGTNYHPEKIGIGKYTGEMAEWLAAHGHEVRVVTAPPYYPEWQVAPDYSTWRYHRECKSGVDVWRCPLWVPKKLSGLKRVLHLASFAFSSSLIMLWQILWKPDVVVAIEPPLFCAPQAWLTARLAGGWAWLHIQDFEVNAAFDLGLLRATWLKRWVLKAERFLMRRFDLVSTISPAMIGSLIKKGVSQCDTFMLPNWVDTDEIFPLKQQSVFRAEFEINHDVCVALYSGNMGEKQGLEVVLEAARHAAMEENVRIQFVLCGEGAAKARLKEAFGELPNVLWLPLQPVNRLNELLNFADIHLLPQRADVADLVMPSKLTGMLASGRPILATAHLDTQVAQVVENRGMVVPPGNAEVLLDALKMLADSPVERARLGSAARVYAEEYLGLDTAMSRFEKELFKLTGGVG